MRTLPVGPVVKGLIVRHLVLPNNLAGTEKIVEFLIFGVIIGVIEDLVAVKLATGVAITFRVVGIVILVGIPFAILGELVVDKIDFVEIFRRLSKRRFGNPRN